MCIYVCIFIYIYICINIYPYLKKYIYMYMDSTYIHIYTCIYIHTHAHTHSHTHTYAHTCMYGGPSFNLYLGRSTLCIQKYPLCTNSCSETRHLTCCSTHICICTYYNSVIVQITSNCKSGELYTSLQRLKR